VKHESFDISKSTVRLIPHFNITVGHCGSRQDTRCRISYGVRQLPACHFSHTCRGTDAVPLLKDITAFLFPDARSINSRMAPPRRSRGLPGSIRRREGFSSRDGHFDHTRAERRLQRRWPALPPPSAPSGSPSGFLRVRGPCLSSMPTNRLRLRSAVDLTYQVDPLQPVAREMCRGALAQRHGQAASYFPTHVLPGPPSYAPPVPRPVPNPAANGDYVYYRPATRCHHVVRFVLKGRITFGTRGNPSALGAANSGVLGARTPAVGIAASATSSAKTRTGEHGECAAGRELARISPARSVG